MGDQYPDTRARPGPGRGVPIQPQATSPMPPQMKSYYPGDMSDPRYRPHPAAQQQYPPPLSAMESPAPFGNASAVAGAEADQWPLPPQAIGQESPRGNSPSKPGSKRPTQRPQRPDHQPPMMDHPRQQGRMGPGYGHHPRGPPPPRPPRNNAEWHGDGYGAPQPVYAPPSGYGRRPPPQSHRPDYSNAQPAMYNHHHYQMHHPPPNAPPYGRRGPQGYHHPPGPMRPGPEGGSGMRAASRPGNLTPDHALGPFTPPYADSVKYPSYYFEERESTPTAGATTSPGNRHHDSPMEPQHPIKEVDREQPQHPSKEVDSEHEQRDVPTPEAPGVIRQASLGKKTRPTLMNVKKRGSSEDSTTTTSSRRQDDRASKEQLATFTEEPETMPGAWISETQTPAGESDYKQPLEATGAAIVASAVAAGAVITEQKQQKDIGIQRRSSEILVSPISLRNDSASSSSSPFESPRKAPKTPAMAGVLVSPVEEPEQPSRSLSPIATTPKEDLQTRRALASTSPIDSPIDGPESTKQNSLTIDIGAVREAEVRGSITSLPDLIRRATKLRTNLDRGKTASRLGLNFFDFNGSSDALNRTGEKNRRSADMLGALGPPGSRDSKAHFSSLLPRSQLPSDSDADEVREKQEKRKYCGLSLRALVALLVILFLLVAAAIIIPVVLLLVPKQGNNSNATPAPSNSALARCQQQLTCHNGALHIIGSGNSCSCLCVDGYTGKSCTTLSETGCTTISTGPAKNATVGEDLPQLISEAKPTFNIPLDGETLLGLFSKNGLSCTTENSLVTFTGPSTGLAERTLLDRAAVEHPSRKDTAPSDLSRSKSQPSAVEFAGVAVLYIFQATSELKTATTAQENFRSYFASRRTPAGAHVNAKNITLGNGFSADILSQSLVWNLSNGTTVAS